MDKISKRTFRYDLIKDCLQGVIESGIRSFSLLIAKRVFNAPNWIKSIIQASEHIGLVFNTLSLSFFAKYVKIATKAWAICFLVTALGFFLAGSYNNLFVYSLFIVFTKLIYKQKEPIMVEVYAENYRKHERGTNLSWCLTASALSGILMAKAGGYLLDKDLNFYKIICYIMGIASIGAAIAVIKIPPCNISKTNIARPFANVSYLWKDKLFGYMKIGWLLLGFGNLMTLPMRTEYLCDKDYGLDVSNTTAALILFTIPSVFRIFSMRIWGGLFDKINFVKLRIFLNSFWIIGLFLFFHFKNLTCVGLGSAFIGMAMGGGMLIWTLWLTKIAPKDKVSAYMSAHTAIAGVRGLISPFLSYYILSKFCNIKLIANIGISCTIISTLIFISVLPLKRIKDL